MAGRRMGHDEMAAFVDAIGRTELRDEIEDARRFSRSASRWDGYPRYLRGACAALVALGYDGQWVEAELRDALDARWLGGDGE